MIVNIVNLPKRRVRHCRTLLQARAIKNQVFDIGVNRIGTDGAGLEYERSYVVMNSDGDFVNQVK